MKTIDPELLIVLEFGFKQAEKGNNLEMAKAEFVRIRKASGHGHKLPRRSKTQESEVTRLRGVLQGVANSMRVVIGSRVFPNKLQRGMVAIIDECEGACK